MRSIFTAARWGGAAAFVLLCSAASAMEATPSATASSSPLNLEAAHKAIAAVRAQVEASRKNAGANTLASAPGTKPAEYYANVNRAYPPSCLNSPLPLGLWANNPNNALTANITLPGDPNSADANERGYRETVAITVFRVECSGGLSATLLEIFRPSNASVNYYPIFPNVTIGNNLAVRLPDDPNTFFSTTYPLDPVPASDVYMLENFYDPFHASQFNFNNAFTLTVDNLITTDPNEFTTYTFNAYSPPATPTPLPISGYLSSAYYDSAHSGEGLMLEVYDNGDSVNRTFFAAWYTFDPLGLPFWLSAQATFPIADPSTGALINALTNVPTYYVTNGGFAGNFGAKATVNNWGTMSFSFPDCNTIVFSYNGTTGSTAGPTGSGTRTWHRLANINSIVCQ